MFKYQIKEFIQINHPKVYNIINANIHTKKKITMPNFKIAMTPKQSVELFYNRKTDNFYTFYNTTELYETTEIGKSWAWTWYIPSVRIDYNIHAIQKNSNTKTKIINIMCHEMFHVINPKNLPPITETLYRLTKPYATQFYRQFTYSDTKLMSFLEYFYEPEEFWAFAFADSCTSGDLKSIGYQYLPNILKVNLKKIEKELNQLIY